MELSAITTSDSKSTVAQVAFFDNGSAIGASNGPAFSVLWPNVQPGSHALTARATDNGGAATTSVPLNVTVVANSPPQVSLTAPANGASYRESATISFSATVSDSDGSVAKVEFLLDGSVVATSTIAPYTGTATNVTAGNRNITARATDNDGASTTSTSVSITVAANALPSVAITSPANGTTVTAPADIAISASAADADGTVVKVEFFDGATLIGTATSAPYAATLRNASLGTHSLTAKATDNDGGTKVSVPVTITVIGVTAIITAPADGANYVAPATFDVVATASTSSGDMAAVDFLDGTTLLRTFTIAPGASTANLTLSLSAVAAGTHIYTVKARDSGGRSGTSRTVTVTVAPQPTPPSVSLTAPSANAFYIAPALVKLSATASPGSSPIAKVEFFAGSTLIGTVTSSPYKFTWTNMVAGSYNLTAKATDTAGGNMTTNPVAITVAAAPAVNVAPGLDGSTVADDSVLITGTVQTPSNSAVTVNGVLATLTGNGQFFVNNLQLAPGTNAIPITVATQDGQSSTQTINVTSTGSTAFKVSVDASEGVAPLDVHFTVDNPGNAPFGSIEFDVGDDGTVDFTATTLQDAQLMLTLPTAGLIRVRVTVKDLQGAVIYTTVTLLCAYDPIERYKVLAGVFSGMLDQLKVGNVETALNAVSTVTRDQYRALFTALGGNLPLVVDRLGTVTGGSVDEHFGELVIARPTSQGTKGFIITLVKSVDGFWLIEGM